MKITLRQSIFAASLALVTLSMTACAQTPMPDTIKVQNVGSQVITIQSSEEVKVTPDVAEITFAVYSQAEDAKQCQTKNKEDLDKALAVLEGAGIDKTSIQTSGYGLSPLYDWNNGRTVTGYEMTTDITVSDLPIDQAGALISSCVDAGVNSIQSVDYLCSTYDANYQEALKKAVESSKLKAQAIAEAGGASLGLVVKVEEYSANQQPRYNGYAASAKESADSGARAAISLEPGQISIEARIAVDYEIVK